ncbi:MAG TPA: DUF1707 domain-containing protein [Streptosporangiaceae bacterium]|nr:DUF1707 domain-containing protein [Streptosporangiaceae bacterium]
MSASAGSPHTPAGDADRERLLGLLREHYALGNLDDAEFDRRTGLVLAATYTDEAAAALAGLPLLTGQEPGPPPARSRRRHAQSDRPGPGWVPTSERFRDPASQQIVRVWVDPADDSRHYVPERPDAAG